VIEFLVALIGFALLGVSFGFGFLAGSKAEIEAQIDRDRAALRAISEASHAAD